MATTIVEPCPPLLPKYWLRRGARKLLDIYYESYVEDMGNRDKCGDMEDDAYYEGRIDAYREMIFWLTGKYLP